MADFAITRREGTGMATVMARKGVSAERIGAALGLAAPLSPGRATNAEGLSLIATGAGTWLAQNEEADPLWADDLRRRLTGLASVSDQSGAYIVERLAGKHARTVLQRGIAIDLHPDCFGPGAAIVTMIGHIGVVVWAAGDAPAFDVAVYRSYADSFRHWLDQSAAAL